MSKIKTHEDFLIKLINVVGEEYTPLGEYVDSKTKIKMKHNVCGFEYEVLSGNILKGRKCPKCQKRVKNKDTNYFKQEIFEMVGDEYTLNSEYINSSSRINLTHNVCGHTYDSRPNDFQQGKRCSKCAGNIKKTNEQFIEEVKTLVGDEYTFLDEYKNSKDKIEVMHNVCLMSYKVSPNNFIYHNRRCPYCQMSKGEKVVKQFLDKNKINYKIQYEFDDLLSLKGNKLKFDFAVFEDDEISFLIEYDGELHFETIKHFNSEKEFKVRQLHDEMKNLYCELNNIPLIRIPYWEFKNITSILKEGMKQIPR